MERQINSDPQCRRMALRHVKCSGPAALLVQEGETLKVRYGSKAVRRLRVESGPLLASVKYEGLFDVHKVE